MIENKHIFLTGGAGFIGTKIVERLSIPELNNKIYIYDNFTRNSIEFSPAKYFDNVYICKGGDVMDRKYLDVCISKADPDIVIHLASLAGIHRVLTTPVETMNVNTIGTYNLLNSLHRKDRIMMNLDRFIYFSTSEVFGQYAYKPEEHHSTNLMPVGEARWTYSVSKIAAEHMVYANHLEYGLNSVSVRPFNVYGGGQIGEGAIHTFIKRALNNDPLLIQGDGSQIRSWCHVDDMVNGVLLCIENENAIGQTFNIGNPRGTLTIYMLAHLIRDLSGSKSEIKCVPKDHVDVELRIPSISKAKEILGYSPKIEIYEGLKRTIEWYREYGDKLK